MAALDISKSAFANTRELVFETPAMAEGGWRVHATNAIKTLSKAAVPAVLRSADHDQGHETSSMLLNVQHQLEINPSVVLQWRQDHAKEFMQGKGLQINQLVNWVQPLWKAHSQARDDDASQVSRVMSIPGYN